HTTASHCSPPNRSGNAYPRAAARECARVWRGHPRPRFVRRADPRVPRSLQKQLAHTNSAEHKAGRCKAASATPKKTLRDETKRGLVPVHVGTAVFVG